MTDMKCPICNKPMKEQIDGTCISYQETNCICNIAAPKLIWKEMAVLRDKKNIFTKSLRMEKEFAEEECKRLQTELIRTRKALDVAVDGLLAVWRATCSTTKQGSIAYNVLRDLNIKPLDRIKALEQKD